jgi:hypothetical protein
MAKPPRRDDDDGVRPPSWIGTPEELGWLNGIIKAVLVLNVVDAVLTVLWVTDRKATEGNPLLFDLPQVHPVLFVLVKTALVSGGTYLLWRHRDRPLAVVSIFVAFLAYYFLLALHLEAMWLAILHFAGGT